MNKKVIIFSSILVILIGIVGATFFIKTTNKISQSGEITVVPTMNDEFSGNSSWCGTFQLVWNDVKNNLVGKDIEFGTQIAEVDNLNKEDFNETMLSDDYYYKTYGLRTYEMKEKIEKGIKEKFNQRSNILDSFDWFEQTNDHYIFYSMLYRKFDYLKKFDKLSNGKFGNNTEDVKYFGIDKDTDNSVGDQIDVLYYNSQDDFALILNTKSNDEVIFCKNPKGNTFKEMYENMNNNANNYTGDKYFNGSDEFKAPYIKFNVLKEYNELEKKFISSTGVPLEIGKALQSIEFDLDEKGGRIKSEAGIGVDKLSIEVIEGSKPRYFYVDDTFTIFLREKGKDLPYFASYIDDITLFQ